jgi:hypothetical protein
MLMGILARGVMLGSVPGGVNPDEAFAGYEAYSLLHYGTDSSGYAFPVYFNSWGSGMNALNSYLMIPFIAVFGLHTWVIRIPQFLVSCFSMFVFYRLLRLMINRKAAVLGLLYFAVCPWSIIMSRWGLESNLAPGFLLFGLYFFMRGTTKTKFFIYSALFYGLSLYCYATIWPIVPFILIMQILYILWTKKLHFDKNCVISVVLLGVIALPLILFYLINTGHMEEIRTAFFSIPRLTVMREKDISIWDKRHNISTMLSLLINQDDGLYWNVAPKYGLYYKWALPFAIIGMVYCASKTIISIVKRTFMPLVLTVFQFICAFFLGCLIEMNVNRINSIHIPLIIFIVIGMYQVLNFASRYIKHIWKLGAIALGGCFICFMTFYFTEYRKNIGEYFQEGVGEAVERAEKLSGDTDIIYIDAYINYAKILFYGKVPADVYHDTVVYKNYPAAYLSVASFGSYVLELPDTSRDGVYVLTEQNVDAFVQAGWTVEQYGHAAVAYRENVN